MTIGFLPDVLMVGRPLLGAYVGRVVFGRLPGRTYVGRPLPPTLGRVLVGRPLLLLGRTDVGRPLLPPGREALGREELPGRDGVYTGRDEGLPFELDPGRTVGRVGRLGGRTPGDFDALDLLAPGRPELGRLALGRLVFERLALGRLVFERLALGRLAFERLELDRFALDFDDDRDDEPRLALDDFERLEPTERELRGGLLVERAPELDDFGGPSARAGGASVAPASIHTPASSTVRVQFRIIRLRSLRGPVSRTHSRPQDSGSSLESRRMRAVVIDRQGTPVADSIRLDPNWPDPEAGPGEVAVRTEASGLNHLDLWVGRGLPGLDLPYPRISGSDGCGVIEAVGGGVDEAWIGRRVALNAALPRRDPPHPDRMPALPDTVMIGEHLHGTMAERFVAPVSNVQPIGDTDPVDAAAYALAHLTAWRMLVSRSRLQSGQIVLVTGIGGGVALACLAIARHFGCRVIVTSRHQWKLDRALELGADDAVLDTGEDWSRAVRGLTGKRGVDICADSIGKAVHLSGVKALARGGTYVTCGCTTGADATTDLARVFWNQLTIIGSTMGDMDEFRASMAHLVAGSWKPVVDLVVPPSEAASAYARIESGEQFGKVVVDWRQV